MSGNLLLGSLIFMPIIAAVIGYLIGKRNKSVRDYFVIIITIIEFIGILFFFIVANKEYRSIPLLNEEIQNIFYTQFVWNNFCGMGIHFVLDGFRATFCFIAAIMWMMTTIFSKEYFLHHKNRNRYYFFTLMTLGSTIGVFLSADLFTTFIFFEIMSFTSYVWVAQEEKKEALKAAETYLAVAVIGGLVMLFGIFLLQNTIHTLEISQLLEKSKLVANKGPLYIAGGCILFGFGAKAGVFPLHIWLPKAHPVAPAPASALLSGILTKTGVFGILIVSCNLFFGDELWGRLILVLGILTMFGGALLALFSVDIKRTLACSSMSQIGFILIGIATQNYLGKENALAVRGTFLHMMNHSLFKLVLFIVAGIIFMNLHNLNLNEIRGFGRKKPLLHFAYLMGALGIGGIPLWSGYISKTLLHESIVECINVTNNQYTPFKLVEWIFLISGGLTVAYMLKLYICLFIEKNLDITRQEKFEKNYTHYMNKATTFSLLGSAILLPFLGFTANKTMMYLSDFSVGFMNGAALEHSIHFYSWENLRGSVVSIAIGIVLYCVVVRGLLMRKSVDYVDKEYINAWPKWIDIEDYIYRPILLKVFPFIGAIICRGADSCIDALVIVLRKTIYKDKKLPQELVEGTSFTYAIGTFLDRIIKTKNKIFHTYSKNAVSYTHRIAVKREELLENNTIIARSLSFGLFMFCLGLCLTLIYLLFL